MMRELHTEGSMEDIYYEFTHRFKETNAFSAINGKMSESARRDLHFYLMQGRGELISGTGGLKVIRCDIGGAGKREIRDVVFAAYNCPRIRTRIYYLLAKCRAGFVKDLSEEERNLLTRLKEKVDKYVRRKYGHS